MSSRVFPGGVQKTVYDAGIQARVGYMQGKFFNPCAISLAPTIYLFNLINLIYFLLLSILFL